MKFETFGKFLLAAIAATCLVIPSAASAKTAKKGKKAKVTDTTVVGTVSVDKNDKGKVTAVKVTTEDGAEHNLVMSAPAKKLAKLDGKKVEITGRNVTKKVKKETVTMFKVKKFKEMPADDGGGDEGGDE